MNELVDTTEMYLRTILDLEEEGIAPLRARIVERLHHSGPTVSQTVARMERDGLLVVADDRRIELSDDGRRYAVRVMRKHRLAERLLTDVIGLDWSLVHTEACRWEHVISADVEQRLVAILDSPQESPYGNPIPGLDELSGSCSAADGAPEHPIALDQTLLTLAGAQPTAVAVRRIGELIQTDVQALEMIREAGVLPGSVLEVSATGRSVSVRPVPPGDGAARGEGADRAPDRLAPVQLPRDIAAHVFATSVTAETPARHAFPGASDQALADHVRHLGPSPAASGVIGSGGGTGPDAMAATVTVSR